MDDTCQRPGCDQEQECNDCEHCMFHCIHVCGQDTENDDGNLITCPQENSCDICNLCHDHCACSTVTPDQTTPDQPTPEEAHTFGGESTLDMLYLSGLSRENTHGHRANDDARATHSTKSGHYAYVSGYLGNPYMYINDYRRFMRSYNAQAALNQLLTQIRSGRLTLIPPTSAQRGPSDVILDAPLPVDDVTFVPPGCMVVSGEEVRHDWCRRAQNRILLRRFDLGIRDVLVPLGGFPRLALPCTRTVTSSEARGDLIYDPEYCRQPYGTLVRLAVEHVCPVPVYTGKRDIVCSPDAWASLSAYSIDRGCTQGFVIVGVSVGTCLIQGRCRETTGAVCRVGPLKSIATEIELPYLPSYRLARKIRMLRRVQVMFRDRPVSMRRLSKMTKDTELNVLLTLSNSSSSMVSDETGCYTQLVRAGGSGESRYGFKLRPIRMSKLLDTVLRCVDGKIRVALSDRAVTLADGHLEVNKDGIAQSWPESDVFVNGDHSGFRSAACNHYWTRAPINCTHIGSKFWGCRVMPLKDLRVLWTDCPSKQMRKYPLNATDCRIQAHPVLANET